jgi:predicted porin
MKVNKLTVALAATGVVGLAAAAHAEEKSYPVNTLLPATTLSGYVDTAAILNFSHGHQVATRFANTGSDRQDGFNVDAVKIALEKPLEEGTWAAGYKVESILGADAAALPGGFGATGSTPVALKQAYVALRAPIGNGLDFKIGQFDPIIGYETFDSYTNPNFSRSFGFALEPLGHTGVLATYQFTDAVGLAAGIANTHFGALNQKTKTESLKTYMAGLTLKAPESWGWLAGSSLYAGGIVGADSSAPAAETGSRPVNLYVGATLSSPWKALTWGVGYDYLFNAYKAFNIAQPAFVGTTPSSYADAFAGYVSYQLTEKLKLNARGEYATTSGGIFLPGGINDEKVIGATLTADYQLWANVITRAEIRWDHAANGGAIRPFGSAAAPRANDISVAANIIYKF